MGDPISNSFSFLAGSGVGFIIGWVIADAMKVFKRGKASSASRAQASSTPTDMS